MFIEIDSLRIHYKVSGSGQPVILLHGWWCSLKTFAQVHAALEKHFQTFSIDLPGFGSSYQPEQPWDTENYAACVERFIKKLDIQNPVIIGHSLGGRIGIRIAAKNHTPLNKLVLVNSAGVKPDRKLKFYIMVYGFKVLKKVAELPILKQIFNARIERYKKKFGSVDYRNAEGMMRSTLVKVVNEDLRNLMPNIHLPTLLIWGEQDNETPLSAARQMEALIPDAKLVVLPNAGHYSFADQFDQFMKTLNEFLNNDRSEIKNA